MTMKVNDAECINCAACEPECPNGAISATGTTFVVDPALCTECVGAHDEPQCVPVCPVDCIVPDPDRRESNETLLERYARIHAAV
jgi:ferredoxin